MLFVDLQRLAQGSTVALVLFGEHWLLPTLFLLALAGRMCSYITFASLLPSMSWHVFFLFERDVGLKRIHHEKWRNFDKISLKAFNQIELKMKALPNTLWGDFKKKNMFCKHSNKSAFLFSWGNPNLFKTCFCLGSLFPQNDPHVKSFFDTKVEANFHQNLQYDTYQSYIHTSLALLGFCLKPIVPK